MSMSLLCIEQLLGRVVCGSEQSAASRFEKPPWSTYRAPEDLLPRQSPQAPRLPSQQRPTSKSS